MKVSEQGIRLIEHFEGISLKAYKCPAGVWTIGIGSTMYESGERVKEGDIITRKRAIELFTYDLKYFTYRVEKTIKVPINQHQLDALVSLCYNIGVNAFTKSTLVKVINNDPLDITIPEYFAMWKNAGGKVQPGLVRRRKSEAHLYTTGELEFFE